MVVKHQHGTYPLGRLIRTHKLNHTHMPMRVIRPRRGVHQRGLQIHTRKVGMEVKLLLGVLRGVRVRARRGDGMQQ